MFGPFRRFSLTFCSLSLFSCLFRSAGAGAVRVEFRGVDGHERVRGHAGGLWIVGCGSRSGSRSSRVVIQESSFHRPGLFKRDSGFRGIVARDFVESYRRFLHRSWDSRAPESCVVSCGSGIRESSVVG